MEEFLGKVRQLLPVLGSDLLTPLADTRPSQGSDALRAEIKGLRATGQRTPNGFVVFKGSQAVSSPRPAAAVYRPYLLATRERLLKEGALVSQGDHLVFTKDVEFPSPSAAAGTIYGGSANGLTAWKDRTGRTLMELEEN
jgi:hypothetical protein